MDDPRRVTRITVTAELSDGSVTQFRAECEPYRAECEASLPGFDRPMRGDLEAFCMPGIPEPARVKVEFSAGREPLVIQTSEDPALGVLNDFYLATGWTWEEARARAAEKNRTRSLIPPGERIGG